MRGLNILIKRLVYWALMAKFFTYMIINFKKFKRLKENGNTKEFHKLGRTSFKYYSDAILKSSKCNFKILGEENVNFDETYLIVSNHSSIVDIAAIIRSFPKYFVFIAKKELSNIPIFGKWFQIGGCIFLDRENIRESVEILNRGIETLKSGISMCIFPEGTRSMTGEVGEFKKGSFRLALKSKVKILPVVLSGTRSVYEDNNNKITKGDVTVAFLDPIDIKNLSSEECSNLHKTVRNLIDEKYKELNQLKSKNDIKSFA